MRNYVVMALVGLALTANAQKPLFTEVKGEEVHVQSANYEWPTNPAVLKKLDEWQDLKFGIMFHWGIYAVPGITESWLLSSEDRFTKRRQRIAADKTYEEFKQWYWDLSNQFNPVRFNPDKWAAVSKEAGCKYLLFTTKHHDGFCMFDSHYSDYGIAKGPYKDSPYADVAKHVFEAYRKQGFWIGAYFSKPDWHHKDYWDPFWATPTRNVNYSIKDYPQKWAHFQQFVANQVDELMTRYGSIDILWLDGGWVRKENGQDILLDDIVSRARAKQPGLIVVDRTVVGRNENYQTPERRIPEKQIANPWETNIPLGTSWGWKPNEQYHSAAWVVNTLAEIVAKGGNLALNIGPSPEGEIDEEAIARLKEVGAWLDKNGEAIYATRITPIYHSGNTWFTASKDGKTLYAIYALPEGESLPTAIEWEGNIPQGRVTLLATGKSLKYTKTDGKVVVSLPKGLKQEAVALKFQVGK